MKGYKFSGKDIENGFKSPGYTRPCTDKILTYLMYFPLYNWIGKKYFETYHNDHLSDIYQSVQVYVTDEVISQK